MLTLATNLAKPDDSYAALLKAHDGLDEETSHRLNACLILLLMNQIGDQEQIDQAIQAARKALNL